MTAPGPGAFVAGLLAAALASLMLPAPDVGGAAESAGGHVFSDGPPPGHTGGFGEPTCHVCHFDQPLDPPDGEVRVLDLPEEYGPGETYTLRVELTSPDMRRAGFQMAARHAGAGDDGRQAGELRDVDDRVDVISHDGLLYAQHTREGTSLTEPGVSRWTVEWTAPEGSEGPVVFHVAANAAAGDDSEWGDHIHLGEVRVEGPAGRK